MKTYKLEVCEIIECEGYEILGYYSKGHHDKLEFAKSLLADTDFKYGDNAKKLIANEVEKKDGVLTKPTILVDEKLYIDKLVSKVRLKWCKFVPWGGGGMTMTYSKEYKKGYFPITVLEF